MVFILKPKFCTLTMKTSYILSDVRLAYEEIDLKLPARRLEKSFRSKQISRFPR